MVTNKCLHANDKLMKCVSLFVFVGKRDIFALPLYQRSCFNMVVGSGNLAGVLNGKAKPLENAGLYKLHELLDPWMGECGSVDGFN